MSIDGADDMDDKFGNTISIPPIVRLLGPCTGNGSFLFFFICRGRKTTRIASSGEFGM